MKPIGEQARGDERAPLCVQVCCCLSSWLRKAVTEGIEQVNAYELLDRGRDDQVKDRSS